MVGRKKRVCPKWKEGMIEIFGGRDHLNHTIMDGFKVPHSIPQDLLLIQEYIGVPPPLSVPEKVETDAGVNDDDISSSDEDSSEESDIANEKEIAADLVTGAVTDEDDLAMKK